MLLTAGRLTLTMFKCAGARPIIFYSMFLREYLYTQVMMDVLIIPFRAFCECRKRSDSQSCVSPQAFCKYLNRLPISGLRQSCLTRNHVAVVVMHAEQ